MNKIDAVGRLVQWAVKLNQFHIKYRPQSTIKAQALTKLIAEFTFSGYGQM